MCDAGFIKVKNWERFQHYKDRNPPWIKFATDTFQNYDFSRLDDASKLLAICIWTLASRSEVSELGSVPNDLEWIKMQCGLGEMVTDKSLQTLEDKGFISVDSKMLADCKQNACLEKSRVDKNRFDQREIFYEENENAFEVEKVESSRIESNSVDLGGQDSKASLPKQKPLDPKVQRVLDGYNKVAEHHGWVRQDKIPGNATAKDSLYKRMEDQQFMEHLDSYVEKLKQIDWFDPQRIVFFLRPRTFMKVMTGEWVRTGATPSPQNTNQHKPTEVKKLMPWDIVKPDPGRIVPQWEKTNG